MLRRQQPLGSIGTTGEISFGISFFSILEFVLPSTFFIRRRRLELPSDDRADVSPIVEPLLAHHSQVSQGRLICETLLSYSAQICRKQRTAVCSDFGAEHPYRRWLPRPGNELQLGRLAGSSRGFLLFCYRIRTICVPVTAHGEDL